MTKQYFIQVKGELVDAAKDSHESFYDSIKEALEDADSHPEFTGVSFAVRRVSDNKVVKRGVIRCLN